MIVRRSDVDHDPHILGPDRAPTPFTADEIRAGCPKGRTIRMLVEADGVEPCIRTNRYLECDGDGATIERTSSSPAGDLMGPPEVGRSTWLELQEHASFPADRTMIATETIETPMGSLECLRYQITEGSSVETFWFARGLPGMPVRYGAHADGRQTSVTTMISNET
jgi:hypothetical protein